MNSKNIQTTSKGGYFLRHILLLLAVILLPSLIVSAKPTPLSFHADLNYLVRALETYHPNPWQSRKRRAFRQDLTANPNILDSYPVGPILKISRALKNLDKKQQDSVTGINLFEQSVPWRLLPVEFVVIEQALYLYSTNPEYAKYNGLLINRIGGIAPSGLIRRLNENFPARDDSWFAQYLRISDLLHYFGARCRNQCELILESSELPKLVINKTSFLSVAQAQPQPRYLIDLFMNNAPPENRILTDIDHSLHWILYNTGLSSTVLFNQMATKIQGMMRDRNILNLVLDLRGIQQTDPLLERRFMQIIKEYIEQNALRKIYAFVDSSTGTETYQLLNYLDSIPELMFVGQSTELALAIYDDPQVIELPNSKITVTIARRYERLLGDNRPELRFIPEQQVSWRANDFFSMRDSLLDATKVLIELSESD